MPPTLKQVTLDLLDSIGRRPQKRLGQNFLIDPAILARIIAAANLSCADTAIEIGTGLGVLTKELADRAQKVITFEIDAELSNLAKDVLSQYQNIDFIRGDFLKIDYQKIIQEMSLPTKSFFSAANRAEENANHTIGKYKIVANVPYYITAPIIEKIFSVNPMPQLIILTVQKEVAERMAAKPGRKTYGSFSIFCQFHGEIELLSLIPKTAFFPQPDVSSAIVKITPHKNPVLIGADKEKFFKIVHAAFQQRRKMLSTSLAQFNINDWPINPQRRPETLTIEEFLQVLKVVD